MPITKNSGTSTYQRGSRRVAWSAIQRSGFSSIKISSTIISAPIVRRSSASSRSTASSAPTIPPSKDGSTSFHEPVRSSMPRRRNVAMAVRFCRNTPTRFVPFATFAGRPSRIKSGSVNNDPLPANVLMKPATKPATGTAARSRLL